MRLGGLNFQDDVIGYSRFRFASEFEQSLHKCDVTAVVKDMLTWQPDCVRDPQYQVTLM